MNLLHSFKRKTCTIIGLTSIVFAVPLVAQVDAVMWGMSAAWSDDAYTHQLNQYHMQNNWTDLRKIYYVRNTAGRPATMNVSASFIKTAGEDSSVSTFYYTSNNLDSMAISIWDTTTQSLKPSNSVAFTYTGTLPKSASFNGIIAMGMKGSFSIYFTYDNQNRIIADSTIMSIGTVFSQTSISTTEYTSTREVNTSYTIDNGVKTLSEKDSTIYNASGKDSVNYSFEKNETSGVLELKEVFKTSYNANGSIAMTETFEAQGGSAKMRSLYGYGTMPDPSVKVLRALRRVTCKQADIRSVVNVSSVSPVMIPGVTYDMVGRAISSKVQSKAHGVFINKQNISVNGR